MTHGSLDCSNIMLDTFGNIKLVEFGNFNHLLNIYARKTTDKEDHIICELGYLKSQHRNDIFCVGYSIYEMVTGEVVNDNLNFNKFLEEIRGPD